MSKYLYTFLEFVAFCLLIAFSVILALDKSYSFVVLDGISLWLACVLPSLFPYFFITACLSNLNLTGKFCAKLSPLTTNLFKVNGSVGYAYFISLVSGYPVGAKMVSDLYIGKVISNNEAVRASALCSTSSPMFLISSVGAIMFKNSLFGILLFLSNVLSSMIIGIIFSFYNKKDKPTKIQGLSFQKCDNLLYESAYGSVISVLVVGAIITLFYLITELLFNLKILNGFIYLFSLVFKDTEVAKGICLGLFECTKGLKQISTAPMSLFTLPLCALICGFGGLSVIMQSIAYLKKAKIKTAPFVLSKLLSAVLNFIICLIFSLLFLKI